MGERPTHNPVTKDKNQSEASFPVWDDTVSYKHVDAMVHWLSYSTPDELRAVLNKLTDSQKKVVYRWALIQIGEMADDLWRPIHVIFRKGFF